MRSAGASSGVMGREQREADQSEVCERAEGDDGDLPRVQVRLLDEEGRRRLVHWLRRGLRREALVSHAV